LLVAVCGGIAAFKTAAMVSAAVQRGAGVTVAMTAAAQQFITPLTFSTLTARRVYTGLFDAADCHDPQHLSLTEAADLIIIAPATANIIGKIAHGIADDLVSTLVMAANGPVLLAPAMNTRMWGNAAVRDNLQAISQRGLWVIPPDEGWLACRGVGAGRMAEPEAILAEAAAILAKTAPKKHGK
jgi:phosphopantothenoylcysteine decarboxylase/phosphopantothenate--cysteine ligase